MIYPEGLTPGLQLAVAALVLGVNAIVYAWPLVRRSLRLSRASRLDLLVAAAGIGLLGSLLAGFAEGGRRRARVPALYAVGIFGVMVSVFWVGSSCERRQCLRCRR